MADLIDSKIESQEVSSNYSIWQVALIGLAVGIINILLTAFIFHFNNSLTIASGVSTILASTAGVLVMVKLQMIRPLVIASASALSLWGLSVLVNSLWWVEALGWSMVLYALSYVLYSWLCRYTKAMPVMITVIIILILVRIAIAL